MKRYFVLSRVKDPVARKKLQKSENWESHLSGRTEQFMKSEYVWLSEKSELREFMLICVTTHETGVDYLDDEIPF